MSAMPRTNGERLATVESHCKNLTDICLEHRSKQNHIETIVHETREDVAYLKGKFDEVLLLTAGNFWNNNKGKITGGFCGSVAGAGLLLQHLGVL